MKLSWRDIVTTLLVFGGGTIVYSKYYNYSWSIINSWKIALLVLAIGGILIYAFNNFDFTNLSILNIGQMMLGVAATAITIIGLFSRSRTMFYSLAIVLGVVWLVDIARHLRHSIIGDDRTSTIHHAPIS